MEPELAALYAAVARLRRLEAVTLPPPAAPGPDLWPLLPAAPRLRAVAAAALPPRRAAARGDAAGAELAAAARQCGVRGTPAVDERSRHAVQQARRGRVAMACCGVDVLSPHHIWWDLPPRGPADDTL